MIRNKAKLFYSEGLQFKCKRCSVCCRHTPGYVFLSANDLNTLAAFTRMKEEEFLKAYCRIIPSIRGKKISLKEKSNYDCIFWDYDGCLFYEARPFQCRSFPFWRGYLGSENKWQELTSFCPGIGSGKIHTQTKIEEWIQQGKEENYYFI